MNYMSEQCAMAGVVFSGGEALFPSPWMGEATSDYKGFASGRASDPDVTDSLLHRHNRGLTGESCFMAK